MKFDKYILTEIMQRVAGSQLILFPAIAVLAAGLFFSATSDNNEYYDESNWSNILTNSLPRDDEEFHSPRFSQEFISAELEIFQYILRYSRLKHNAAFEIATTIMEESEKHGVDPYLVLAVIKVESNFRPNAVSSRGAVGLMQIMPTTARYVADMYQYSYNGRNSLFNPVLNVKLGIAYLSHLEEDTGIIEHALWAYNYGPARYRAIHNRNSGFMPQYVEQVMSFRNYLESQSVQASES